MKSNVSYQQSEGTLIIERNTEFINMDQEDTLENGLEAHETFIDDYSHLRLSYYQVREGTLSFDQSIESPTRDSSERNHTFNTSLTDVSESLVTTQDIETDERQRLREYYISQIPDLPHPSFTMSSIIASASHKMGGDFIYNDRVEQKGGDEDMEFSPQRRSTMQPKRGNSS